MKEQSHKDEMSAAIRGDFQRLRDRGVAATLAPSDDDSSDIGGRASTDLSAGPLAAQEAPPERSVAAVEAPVGSAPEPQADAADELREAEQPGFFARLLGR